MNKVKLIVIAVIILIGAGVALFVLRSSSKEPVSSTNSTGTTSQTQQSTVKEPENGNIFSLSGSGKQQKCTFTYSGPSGEGTGTMYSDGKDRGLMTVEVKTAQGNTGKSNTLLQADKVYGWTESDGQTVGFVYDKAKFTSGSTNPNSSGTNSNVDPNTKFNLSCNNWTVDETMLSVPRNINFMSLPATAPGQ